MAQLFPGMRPDSILGAGGARAVGRRVSSSVAKKTAAKKTVAKKTATKKAKSNNSLKLKANKLAKSKARATRKGRYDMQEVKMDPVWKELYTTITGRTNKKPWGSRGDYFDGPVLKYNKYRKNQ